MSTPPLPHPPIPIPLPRPRPHGTVRGANLSRRSQLFGGPFGRMFRTLPPADYGPDDATSLANLATLAGKMVTPADPADPKDGPDPEESALPALYTYFGQFIDHDLTFDPASSLQKQNDPDALVDYRTPRFDLDNLYGKGPDDQPYLFNGSSFILGPGMTGATATNPRSADLVRAGNGRAIIGDPRNDENMIVSQLQGLWHRFHNKVVKDNPSWSFEDVQQEVRFCYQWILLHDFLPAIIDSKVLGKVLPKGVGNLVQDPPDLQFYHPKDDAFMPLEFSAAAYRFGHSMVRPGYRLNDTPAMLLPIFKAGQGAPGAPYDLRGFQPPPGGAAIDWQRFIDLVPLHYGKDPSDPPPVDPNNVHRLQLAYRIDTALVDPLAHLPKSIAPEGATVPGLASLAQRNLERGWRMRLPSGQDVARAMGLAPLAESDLQLGMFTGEADDTSAFVQVSSVAGGVFADNCPLWTYILAETRLHIDTTTVVKTLDGDKHITTPKLGEVGGRIVAETFLGILKADGSSYIRANPLWTPYMANGGTFGLREFVAFALQG